MKLWAAKAAVIFLLCSVTLWTPGLALGGCTETQQTKGGMVGSVVVLAIGAIGGNAALGMSVGRAAGMGAGYIYSKSKETID